VKILQVAPDYYPNNGGVERHVQSISERLVALGHDVVVATLAPPGARRAPPMLRNNVQVRTFPSVGVPPAYRIPVGLFSWLLRSSFDIFHVHNYHGCLIPIVAAARRRRCMVVSPHLNDRAHSRTAQLLHHAYAPLGRWSLTRASAVVCVSAAERDRLVQRFRLDPNHLILIPNGADALAPMAAQPVQDHDPNLLLVVGRLEAYKRIDCAIEALRCLPTSYRLVIVGDGPLRTSLEGLASLYGVAGRVTFAGCVSDEQLAQWYGRASAVIALSSAEAFGLTVVEAIAGGGHAICSDIPAFREVALRFPGRVQVVLGADPRAIVAAVQRVTECLNCPPVELGDYSWSAVTDRLVELYGRLLRQSDSDRSARIQLHTNTGGVG
jgi:glycosyltransferase involved in cell wall biosynthesis